VKNLCNGGCPKDRFAVSSDGDQGQNYLCQGLELFFKHTRPAMVAMAQLLQQRRPPSDIVAMTKASDTKRGPNAHCPCGSGLKFPLCHGDEAPRSPFSALHVPVNAPQEEAVSISEQSL